MDGIRIAIDGPAGAGKSTIAKDIAKTLGVVYLDTGAMYRAVAYEANKNKIDVAKTDEIAHLMQGLQLEIKYKDGEQSIFVNGEDVTGKIRTPEVTKCSSVVAAIPEVRLKLVEIQRQIADKQSVVMDGRDIGTYVLPNAEVKIFLTASVEERARRRSEDLIQKGINMPFAEILKDIAERDHNDSTRAFAPLKKAEDAVEIDTTSMTISEVVQKVVELAGKRMG